MLRRPPCVVFLAIRGHRIPVASVEHSFGNSLVAQNQAPLSPRRNFGEAQVRDLDLTRRQRIDYGGERLKLRRVFVAETTVII
jgi:hypothetical protein